MSKTELFSAELQRAATIFKALGHPARLAIIKYLASSQSCICGDISNELPLSRTTVNQHLKELKDLNLVIGEIEGVKTNYCLNPESFTELRKVIGSYLDDIECCKNSNCNL